MTKEGTIPSSTIEFNTKSDKKITSGPSYKDCDDNPNMEQPILMTNSHTLDDRQTNTNQIAHGLVDDHMLITRMRQAKHDISDSVVEFLKESNRPSTRKNYEQA
ncbi:hypothetical protein G6F70_007069 [Rhizopus microsporus]|uniref:Uncharacterized protein n=1 Tax=Rhizopus microsporus TaxID=58291 RepID=A0A1X0RMR6_RHIZD|nr:hypothetical protein G6F71_005644 [Rhizopus microsporus]KAG1196899.1 hypothetical protein G6F70_007069 [Rhizopus microsporus]KAG1208774.1 hypothetical protein G6F69_006929 [Rhizopus microsporus]ORE13198.1 hypothetical protein BCV71DRAFT_72982 [Rhizopus microsporus]